MKSFNLIVLYFKYVSLNFESYDVGSRSNVKSYHLTVENSQPQNGQIHLITFDVDFDKKLLGIAN